jgi:uncharacterized protein with NRDE domain
VCLLIAFSRVVPGAPLVVGANRDELYDRPAQAMTVLRSSAPRTLGGRDELAGGTWLAVNDAGVFAGVTNRPTPGGRDPAKRSRGELPLLATCRETAAAAVEEMVAAVDPSRYNPAWLLVGDRRSLFTVEVHGQGRLQASELPPGLHVLENRPLAEPSAKAEHVRGALAGAVGLPVDEVERRLRAVLRDHRRPPTAPAPRGQVDHPEQVGHPELPLEVGAACVHSDRYGTRWSALLRVPEDPGLLPALRYCEGAPCSSAYRQAALWEVPAVTGGGRGGEPGAEPGGTRRGATMVGHDAWWERGGQRP